MATAIKIDVKPEVLTWAYQRAGYDKEGAIAAFSKTKSNPGDLEAWLSHKDKPSVSQLQKFASKFLVPFGYLLLDTPPDESIPFPMFRGKGLSNHFDVNVYDTILYVQRRQNWLEEYLSNNEIDTCQLTNTIHLTTPISNAVSVLRNELQLKSDWAFSYKDSEKAVNELAQQLEQAGIFLVFNGVVGNNTRRKVKVSECRGFALFSETAPYIFVNNADSKTAQMFTLIHEAAHIMLGESAGHAGEELFDQNKTESYCNKVAAEFLVPADTLRNIWMGDVRAAAEKFKVSEIVIARRAHDLRLMSYENYRYFCNEYYRTPITQKKGSGGNFHAICKKRVGLSFAIHVRNAVNNRQLSYTEAYRLTGLYGNTYQSFMAKNI